MTPVIFLYALPQASQAKWGSQFYTNHDTIITIIVIITIIITIIISMHIMHCHKYHTWKLEMVVIADGHTTSHMQVKWKRGFDKSDVTENNSISLAQVDLIDLAQVDR